MRARHLAFILCLAPAAATANNDTGLREISDEEMAGVAGSDGLTASLSAPVIRAAALRLNSDTGTLAGGVQASDVSLYPAGGAAAVVASLTTDVGANALSGSMPAINLEYSLSRFRLGGTYTGPGGAAGDTGFRAQLTGDATRSFGAWTLVSDLAFRLTGQPFYGSPSTTNLRLALSDGTLLYQQNWYYHANIALHDLDFAWDMPAGTIDVTNAGLVIAGDSTFTIDFDLYYKFNPDQDMTNLTANDRPMLGFAWGGLLTGAEVHARSGGVWDTAANAGTGITFAALPGGRSEGLSTGLRWNYGNNFTWRIGHVGGDCEYLQFGDWRNLEHNAGAVSGRYGFDFPMIALDAVDAGSDSNAGGGLCWGGLQTTGAACTSAGTLLRLRAGTVEGYAAEVNRSGGAAMIHLIRNGNLLAWSNSVKVGSDAKPALDTTQPWGLVYTLANINSNVYLYPGGSESDPAGGSRGQGVIGDILFMTQSREQGTENWTNASVAVPTRWSHGSHFMIADASKQQAVGILGASFLLAADDLRLWLKNTWAGEVAPNNHDGGIDLVSPRARAQLKGLLGAARIPNGVDLVRVANADLNFEGLWNFRLSPPPTGSEIISYSAAIRFRCGNTSAFGCRGNAFADATGSVSASGNGSYISLGEPGRTDVDLRFSNMSGDIAWTGGTLQLRAADETGTGKPDLRFANTLLVGASAAARMTDAAIGPGLGAGGAAGRTFTTVTQFGGNEAWTMAIPAASMYAAFTIRPQ